MKKLFLGLLTTLVLLPSVIYAQPLDEYTRDRVRYVTNTNGQLVSVVSPVDNNAQVVFRQGAEEVDVIGVAGGDFSGLTAVDGVDVTGVGHPAMNNKGVIAVTVALDSENIDIEFPGDTNDGGRPRKDSALLVGTPGDLKVIAKTLQNVTESGDVICSIEPMPQINDSGQVFFGATIQSPNSLWTDETSASRVKDFCGEDGGRVAIHSTPSPDRIQILRSKTRKGIFRYTPGVGVERLLLASMNVGKIEGVAIDAPIIETSDSRWWTSGTSDEFYIIDTHLIAHSHNSVTESGAAFVFAWLTNDGSFSDSDNANSDNGDYRTAILYLDGGEPQLVAATKRAPDDNSTMLSDTDFGYLGKLAADPKGRVVFKTAPADDDINCPGPELYCYADGLPSQLYEFTPNSGLAAQPLVASGGTVPGTGTTDNNTFNGFPPLMSTNASGAVAFTAGLNIPNICALDVRSDGQSTTDNFDWADPCKGVYLAAPNGAITELARNTRSAVAGAGAGATRWTSPDDPDDVFYFDGLTATAVIDRTRADRVYFVAWQADGERIPYSATEITNTTGDLIGYDFSADQFQSRNEGGLDEDDGKLGIFVWDNGTIRKVIAEGDEVILGEGDNAWEAFSSTRNQSNIMDRLASLLGIMPAYAQDQAPTAEVVRLFLPQPQLRGHAGTGEFEFVVRAWFDVADESGVFDGTADFDSMVNLGEAVPPVPVPVSSNILAIILGAMLMLFGLVILRGRA